MTVDMKLGNSLFPISEEQKRRCEEFNKRRKIKGECPWSQEETDEKYFEKEILPRLKNRKVKY